MRIDLSRLQDIDRITLVAGAVLIIGVLLSAGMFLDLTKRESAADKLSKEFHAREQQADALPKPGIATEGASNERLERFSSFIVQPALATQLLEDVSRLAAENNLADVAVTSEEHVINTIDTDAAVLQSLGIVKYLTITMTFKSEYEDAAKFLGTVEHLPRPLMIRTVDMRREPPRVAATVAMQVYEKGS
jgi:Tfp pilus assembly protein PilO